MGKFVKESYLSARISIEDKEEIMQAVNKFGITLSSLICILLKKWLHGEIKL